MNRKHRKGNLRETGLRDLSNNEVERRATDPNLSPKQRRRYQKEAKCRRRRNRQKRWSN